MGDWPYPNCDLVPPGIRPSVIVPHSPEGNPAIGDMQAVQALGTTVTTTVWPAANRAYYIPFLVYQEVTVFAIAFRVNTQSGNLSVSLYRWGNTKTLLYNSASTAVAVSGTQTIDIPDTVLAPGSYAAGMCVDNITAVIRGSTMTTVHSSGCGIRQEALGGVATWPTTPTPVVLASSYFPQIILFTRSETS